ncbi:hypothetical protein [Devosia sp. Root635]|uniref:hypothetical protein n=1 Tax=Devosia sp. Root635 TaxID=1736575 RepID=UPI0006F818F8|nr:hypothetical protein [Devosia sp. Root635]KRA41747.1 hypothetical protein ASD80_11970 [Devosia sp. Root635]
MRRSHTISLYIDYPYDTAYRFLANPLNYGEWAAVDRASYRPLDNGDWEAMTNFGGIRHFRFTPVNAFGVLDHAIFVPGEKLLWTPMRVTPNEEGTELTFTFYQRPGMGEEEFASAIEWITTDFLTLKSLLEALRR